MNPITERLVRSSDVLPEQEWKMAAWCIERGGDEFSLGFLGVGGEPASSHDRLRNALAPFFLGRVAREQLTVQAGARSRNPTGVWRCNADTLEILRAYFPDGLLAAPSYPATGWFEDFTIYRRGKIMLGVVSHEEVCVLRLTAPEYGEFSELNIKSHESMPPERRA